MNKLDLEAKLIDANALMEFARNHINGMIDCNDIARFPVVEAEPVRHGEWEAYPSDGYMRCSNCRVEYLKMKILWSYCPHCGAKMDLED